MFVALICFAMFKCVNNITEENNKKQEQHDIDNSAIVPQVRI